VPTDYRNRPHAYCSSLRRQTFKKLEGLLLSESKRADEAATYAQTCYNWIKRLRDD